MLLSRQIGVIYCYQLHYNIRKSTSMFFTFNWQANSPNKENVTYTTSFSGAHIFEFYSNLQSRQHIVLTRTLTGKRETDV